MPRLLIPGPFEPSLQFRYTIFSDKLKNAFFSARSAQQPSFDNSPIEYHHGNGSFFVKGKTKWNPLNMKCYQFDGITILEFWLYLLKHQPIPDQAIDNHGEFYKHDLRVSILGPEEIPTATWILHGAFYEGVDFGQMDRSSNEVIEIDCTIRYDYATYKPFIG